MLKVTNRAEVKIMDGSNTAVLNVGAVLARLCAMIT